MKCPKCDDVELAKENIEHVRIDRCPQCHGIWLDALELEKVIEAHPKKLLHDDAQYEPHPHEVGERLTCPRCAGEPLIKLNSRLRPGIIVDSCTVCYGTWLDAGELTRLAGEDWLGRIRRFLLD